MSTYGLFLFSVGTNLGPLFCFHLIVTVTVLNREYGDYVTTNSPKPLFMKMANH